MNSSQPSLRRRTTRVKKGLGGFAELDLCLCFFEEMIPSSSLFGGLGSEAIGLEETDRWMRFWEDEIVSVISAPLGKDV